ncbi:hypothetical protein DITRI_Ditri06bG0152300 [Diplodiscus trichospermus]
MKFKTKEKRFKELVKDYGLSKEFKETSTSEACERHSSPCTRSKSKTLQHCGLIQSLIEKDCRLQAIKYVCELDMADKFSPTTFLQDHLRYVKKIAREREQKDDSVPSQIVAITKEIADLKAVIKCVKLYKIGFDLSKIQKGIRKLEMKKLNWRSLSHENPRKRKSLVY